MANDGTLRLGVDIDEAAFRSGLSKLGKTAAIALGAATAAVGAFAKSAVDAGMSFDSSMSQVAATMGKTVDEIQDLRKFAMEMGATTSFSASEAADGLNILAQAGLDATDQIAALPHVMDLAAAGAMGLEASASYVTAAVKGFGDGMENAQYYADLMAKGATLANTDVAGLGEAMSRSAATASTYGQQADRLTLSLLRLAEQNVTGEAASTALNRAMSDLYTPTDSARKALEELGISAYDAFGNAKDFNVVVDELKTALNGMSQEQANAYAATIFTTQGLNAFNKMTATSTETMQKFEDGLSSAFGSAAQQAETQLDNLEGDIIKFKSALEGAQIVISDQMTPALRELVQFGTEAISTLSQAFEEGGLNGAMEALGTVLSDGLAMVMKMLPTMMEAGMGLLNALGQGIISNLPLITNAALEVVLMLAEGLINALPSMAEAAVEIIATLADGIAAAIPDLVPVLVDAIIAMADVLTDPDNLSSLVNAAIEIILALADGILEAIPDLLDAVPEIVRRLVEAIVENLPSIALAGFEILGALVYGILGAIPNLVLMIPEIIAAIVQGLLDGVGAIADAGAELFESFAGGFLSKVNWFIDQIAGFVDTVIGWLGGGNAKSEVTVGGHRGSGAASRSRAAAKAIPATENGGAEESASLTASRAAAVMTLERAIPAAEARVTAAESSMAPAAAYSAPAVAGNAWGGSQESTAPTILRPNWTIRFTGNLAQVGQVLKPVIDAEDLRVGGTI